MRRRDFVLAGVGGVTLAGCRRFAPRPAAAIALERHDLDTIAALADTFLPGDDGTPGAHEVNALATIVDPAYGLRPYIPELVGDLDQWCLVTKHAGFVGLSADARELAVEQRMGLRGRAFQSLYKAAYEGALALTKLAYFGALTNKLGTNWLAFPGDSRGYAPGSAAGAWASLGAPWAIARGQHATIGVEGAGRVSRVRLSAFATTDDDIKATLRVRAPDGNAHELALPVDGGEGVIDDVALPLAGGPAAGAWRLEVASVAGGQGRLELWSLRLRTDLDDASVMP